MTEQDRELTSDCHELTSDELNHVSGGVVCITHPGAFNLGGGSGAGKVKFSEFVITKAVDKASPLF